MPEPRSLPVWQVWAVRTASAQRPARDNYLYPAERSGTEPIDFIVFVASCGDELVVIDTGFSREAGERRGRELELSAADAVRAVGLEPGSVRTVVLSHLHYDHAGNVDDFPDAQVVLQRAELEYAAGPAMRHHRLSHFFEVDDVVTVIRRLFAGTVTAVDGRHDVAPGFELHLVAGHTRGLQVARIHTERGWIVLACDGVHYFDNIAGRNPFPALVDLEQVLDGYERIEALADSPAHIVPGHDPQLFTRYDLVASDAGHVIAALHTSPTGVGGGTS
ncbi:MAG: N-acyl homoserine lactonase family protein [Microbacterium sp.]|uniref:N-acyl homoserine lactonase family protein n=1 Tax=Microbacterium sp. TaxID=51671 RepID=UPI001DCB8FF1|nr:N-acyl homoserine lactonase family protein [Microbacterium sp.]MBW8764562.1 N-acyl homoserine lactonase family protein [Microbacterium sp.]